MTEEWRQISAFPGVDIRRLYVDGKPTDLFMLGGRLGYLTAEWREQMKTLVSETKQLFVEGIPTLVRSFDGRMMPEISGGATIVDKQVGASADDAYYTDDGTFDATSQTAYLGRLTGKGRETFARWTGVSISDTIDTAYIELYAHNNGSGTANLKVYGVDEDNPDAPTTAGEYEADPLTTAAVDWDETFTIDTWEGSDIELKTIFQELVDSYTISNDAVMVQVKDDGSSNNNYNQCRQYNFGAGAQAPKLHIEYSAAAAITKIMGSTMDLGDDPIRRMWTIRPLAETEGLVEAPVRRMWSVRPEAETVGIVDSLLRRARSIRLIAETVSIAETFVKATFTTIVKLMAETVGISDVMLKIAGMVRVASETVSLSEAAVRRFWSVRITAETEGISEAIVRRMWSIRQMASTVNLDDSFVRRGRSVRQFAETIGISDGMLKIAGMVRVAGETVGIVENWVKLTVSTIVKIMATETVGLAETAIERFRAVRLMAETIGLSDGAMRRAWAIRLMAETLSVAESWIKRAWMVRLISEAMGLVESFVRKMAGLFLGIEEIELDSYITLSVDLDSAITRTVDKSSVITRSWEADSYIQ
jgi:hypothetical protein